MVEVFDAWQSGQITGAPAYLAALSGVAPSEMRIKVGDRDLLVDTGVYDIGVGEEAVVCSHGGQISVVSGPLAPSSMVFELGKRSVVDLPRVTRDDGWRQETRSTMYIVLGRVMRSADQLLLEKPVKVRAYSRALPARDHSALCTVSYDGRA